MGLKSCLSCMSEDFKGPLISLDGPHSTFEVYFGPDNMPKLFFLSGGRDRPRFDSTHQNGCISCMLDTGRRGFHFRHILPWQHRPTAAFQHKDAFLVRGLGGETVIDRYLFRFHGENSLRLGLSDSSGVQRIEEEQSDVPQGCHFGYLG